MTVTPSTCDVADKAVSTDDGGSGMEVARLEAVLAALVETKVEAIKASSTLGKRCGSAPASPHRLRLTSTSTASSSLNHHHHHHHHQHNRKSHQPHHYHHHHRLHRHHRRKRHDSAPCGELIEDDHHHRKLHHGKGRRRASESPRSPKKRRRHSRSPNPLHGVGQEVPIGLDSHFELLGMEFGEQDLALINFERTREALSDSCEYPRLHPSACYFTQSTAQLKMRYDDDDYVALNIADELDEEETLSGPEKIEHARQKYHRPRKKRKRKRRKVEAPPQEEEIPDPEELPPRARWTIVATACLLLAMSLLLVGVTLRMAPIIDEMGDGRRASTCKRTKSKRVSAARRKDSVRPARTALKEARKVIEDARELEQARRHRRIAMIVLGTFLFLLASSVLAVVVTLTHSSFLSPVVGSKELTDHRAQLRRENEELINSLNREYVPENTTSPP